MERPFHYRKFTVDQKTNKMMLSNALENLARTQSVKNGSQNGKSSPRRTSVVGGVFDVSPRNSMGDIKKLRKESMLPQTIRKRKDSNEIECVFNIRHQQVFQSVTCPSRCCWPLVTPYPSRVFPKRSRS
ncbi:hypothetical protein L596_002509 [Steinernema carpocapsae]|uniref:Uncharacterized protein n=1 Tax=Steinernema carpocapsae TaxID=34508 RepID=A0A4U8UTE1_STECR|nr:hypothetical protein L596_002509 [Steinernema carpocapsae]